MLGVFSIIVILGLLVWEYQKKPFTIFLSKKEYLELIEKKYWGMTIFVVTRHHSFEDTHSIEGTSSITLNRMVLRINHETIYKGEIRKGLVQTRIEFAPERKWVLIQDSEKICYARKTTKNNIIRLEFKNA